MSRASLRERDIPSWIPAVGAVASVLSLLAPWVRSGRVDRSTIDLLSSASALDVWSGGEEIVALSAWYLMPVLAAGAVIGVGWQRIRFSAWCAVPIGPLMTAAFAAVVWSPFAVRWGAWLGIALGLTTSFFASLLLIGRHDWRQETWRKVRND